MKKILMAVMITAVLVLNPAAVMAETGQELFQKGLVKERAEGNFSEAIRLYQSVVQKFAGDRPLAAKALLQMAECYEKLGMAESRKAYERVVREFSDQNEQVTVARGRLSTLGHGATGAGVTVRQVWSKPGTGVWNNNIFPDGRRLAFIDYSNGNLMVVDLVSGQTSKVTAVGPREWVDYPSVSPDSRLIAFQWSARWPEDKRPELRIVGVDGSSPRVLYGNNEIEPEPVVWFPDGKHLLARFILKDRTTQIAVIAVADGKARVLKSADWQRRPGHMGVSPDGQQIIYDIPASDEAPARDIHLMAADGGTETALVRHPADDTVLGWTPDGKNILFSSDRSGSMSVWALSMSGNKPTGEPRQVKSNLGNIQPLGFTRSGSFYYSEAIGSGSEVYIAALDAETGKVTEAPRIASSRHMGAKGAATFSDDGKLLVYLSGPRRELASRGGLTIQSLDSGAEYDIPTSMSYINPAALMHTGKEILVIGRDGQGRDGQFRVDPRTGEVSPMERGFRPPDGKKLVYPQPEEGGGMRIMARDLQSGKETVLHPANYGSFQNRGGTPSPDGEWVVFRSIDPAAGVLKLMAVPISGGDPATLVTVKTPAFVGTFSYTPDSRYILYSQGVKGDDEVWRVSIADGQPQSTGLKAKRIQRISVHPDGKRVAVSSFGDSQDSVWVMENWQSELRASR